MGRRRGRTEEALRKLRRVEGSGGGRERGNMGVMHMMRTNRSDRRIFWTSMDYRSSRVFSLCVYNSSAVAICLRT